MTKNTYALEYVESNQDKFEGATPSAAYSNYAKQAVADSVEPIYLNYFSFLVACMGYDIRSMQGVRTFTKKPQTRKRYAYAPHRNPPR